MPSPPPPSPPLGKFAEWLYMNSPIEFDASDDGGDRFARKFEFFEESAAQNDRGGSFLILRSDGGER